MHARQASLHFNRTIDELYHRMNNALRMNNDINPFIWDTKKPACFERFQPFVHQRGRVYRDLRPHSPRRMGKSLFDCHCLQLLKRGTTEWSTRSSQDQAMDLGELFSAQTLPDGAM